MKKLLTCFGVLLIVGVGYMAVPPDDEKPMDQFVLKEVVEVHGTCWENHVGQRDQYAGHILRWQALETGKVSTYGFIHIPFSAQRIVDEGTHPTVYRMPSTVSFTELAIDTSQPKWILHGVSDHGENSQAYDTTCEVDVVKRGMRLPDIVDVMKREIDLPTLWKAD